MMWGANFQSSFLDIVSVSVSVCFCLCLFVLLFLLFQPIRRESSRWLSITMPSQSDTRKPEKKDKIKIEIRKKEREKERERERERVKEKINIIERWWTFVLGSVNRFSDCWNSSNKIKMIFVKFGKLMLFIKTFLMYQFQTTVFLASLKKWLGFLF